MLSSMLEAVYLETHFTFAYVLHLFFSVNNRILNLFFGKQKLLL